MDIDQFAFNVASTTRKIREAANAYHDAYVGATPEQRAELRRRWMLGHLAGQQVKNPERVLSAGKGDGAKPEHIKAIDRASSDFRYMVVRPDVSAGGSGKTDPVAKLLSAYSKLTAAQQRKFRSSI